MNAMDPPNVRRGWMSMNVRERLAYLAGELTNRAEGGRQRGRPHRAVPLSDSVGWSLAPEPRIVPWARSQVRSRLVDWSLGGLTDSAELLVSELVTNAMLHGAGRVGLRLILGRRSGQITFRCEVSDDGPELPYIREAEEADESGRGLLLVSRMADRWGSDLTETGKVVWFELVQSADDDQYEQPDAEGQWTPPAPSGRPEQGPDHLPAAVGEGNPSPAGAERVDKVQATAGLGDEVGFPAPGRAGARVDHTAQCVRAVRQESHSYGTGRERPFDDRPRR